MRSFNSAAAFSVNVNATMFRGSKPPFAPGVRSWTTRLATTSVFPEPAQAIKRAGILDCAVAVLQGAKEPLGCQEMVQAMLERKLWATNGRTPAATLYAAILRELQHKGKQARFEKVARGRFTLRKGA